MYPQINEKAGLNDAPPTYDETIRQQPYPTAPTAPIAPSTGYIPPLPIQTQPQLHQQQQQPIILVQSGFTSTRSSSMHFGVS
ncbi:uncharacterized protein LOC129951554 isoform X2 [Eupeodes corollae]|uniref:uncharacterized protein LOC129951554 isoform X2 n=1 Tax=Eupeodes corollae TaxID=290404 RepID=UPI00248F756F|nr:uncharacterized protein LOC129951554 isoform X2 [Eupeodes corollae]